jgi:hypothetical protein
MMKIWRFGVMEERTFPSGGFGRQSKAGAIEVCVYWMQFALEVPDAAYSAAPVAIDYGLLEVLPRTQQYMGIDILVTTLGMPKMGPSGQRVSFFIEEVFLPYMLLGNVYQAMNRALHRIQVATDKGTVQLADLDERIPTLVRSWGPAFQVVMELGTGQAPEGCYNSRVRYSLLVSWRISLTSLSIPNGRIYLRANA